MTAKEMNELKADIYTTACEHGFHEQPHNDNYYLGLVISEVGECIDADRKGRNFIAPATMQDLEGCIANGNMSMFKALFEEKVKNSIYDELADIIIRLLDMVGSWRMAFDRDYHELSKMTDIERSIFYARNPNYGYDEWPGQLYTLSEDVICKMRYWDNRQDWLYEIFHVVELILLGRTSADIWDFVKFKALYNKMRPKYNGKKY